jgi:hypothetical protein
MHGTGRIKIKPADWHDFFISRVPQCSATEADPLMPLLA